MNQISKNSLDSHNVTLLWCGLKSCTHTHTQHDIRPRCTKIKQRTDHGTILPLVYLFAVRVEVKLTLEWHGGLGSFKTIILEPLEHVLSVFGLVDEGSPRKVLHFKAEEELQLSHHGHLKLVGH